MSCLRYFHLIACWIHCIIQKTVLSENRVVLRCNKELFMKLFINKFLFLFQISPTLLQPSKIRVIHLYKSGKTTTAMKSVRTVDV